MTLAAIALSVATGSKFRRRSFENGYWWYFNKNGVLYDEYGMLFPITRGDLTASDFELEKK